MRWDGIAEFLAVANHGSFTAAAEALQLSTAQVSKRVANLERRLAVRLLYRTTRQLALTEEGKLFRRRSADAAAALDEAEALVRTRAEEPSGTLRINVTGAFQERFLVPMIAEFLQNHPAVCVDLDFSDKPVDLVAGNYDLSIRPGELADSGLVARRLAGVHYYTVASGEYLTRCGTPESPEALDAHNCLAGTETQWRYRRGDRDLQVSVSGNWHSTNAHALLAAVRAGAGIAWLPYFAVMRDISTDRLVQLLPEFTASPVDVWLVFPDRRPATARVRAFTDFLLARIQPPG